MGRPRREYDIKIPITQHECFGSFSGLYEQTTDLARFAVVAWIIQNNVAEATKLFHLTAAEKFAGRIGALC